MTDSITRRHPETGQRQEWHATATGGKWINLSGNTFEAAIVANEPSGMSAADIANTAVGAALAGQPNPSRDAVSFEDRTKGFNSRLIWPMMLVVILAIVATLAWSLVLIQLGTPKLLPFMLDRLFIFLLVLGGMGFWVWTSANRQEYRHSHAGIRHKQISTAERMHERQLEHERQMKRDALTAVLQLEDTTDGNERQ